LELLGRYKERYGFRLYHYVLMNNHIHLLMETSEEASISKIRGLVGSGSSIFWRNRDGINRKAVDNLWADSVRVG
ncbi:hypothetical protein CH333_10530, partial [candidate division WOR-3 bacterium JGI_Cruoil_03_44_89]